MRARELKYFHKKLDEKRHQLVNVVQKTESYGREVDSEVEAMDIADKASSSYTKEFMFSKSDSPIDSCSRRLLMRYPVSTTAASETAPIAARRSIASVLQRCRGLRCV